MSRSFRTQKESIIAERNSKRDQQGEVVLPRIIERKPAHGDIHPLSKKSLRGVLKKLPVEYLYGLKKIELRPRNGEIGSPFGYYLDGEKTIVLYSLPMQWNLSGLGLSLGKSLVKYYAQIELTDEKYCINWPEESIMGLWFYSYVITHELGHHHVNQYRHKNGTIKNYEHHEIMADLHSSRLMDDLFKGFKNTNKQ